jgi:hypothetical protein
MCNKCQTVWVPSQNRGGKPGDYRAYSGSRKMICPQCESMAATFFRTGQFRHSCPGCGGKVTRCAVQTLGTKMAASSRP